MKPNSILMLLEVVLCVCFRSALSSNQILKLNPPHYKIHKFY